MSILPCDIVLMIISIKISSTYQSYWDCPIFTFFTCSPSSFLWIPLILNLDLSISVYLSAGRRWSHMNSVIVESNAPSAWCLRQLIQCFHCLKISGIHYLTISQKIYPKLPVVKVQRSLCMCVQTSECCLLIQLILKLWGGLKTEYVSNNTISYSIWYYTGLDWQFLCSIFVCLMDWLD